MSTKKTESNRITVTLPPELSSEANAVSTETGVSLSDLLRQGMIRLLLERRETGSVKLMQLTRSEPAMAA
jgi:metal-responsive CopG/Arc/MetJ family transcriptional regulator